MANAKSIPRLWDTAIPLKEMRIPAIVKKTAATRTQQCGGMYPTWILYMQEYEGELLCRTFASSHTKKYGSQLYEVMREIPGHDLLLVRNMWYSMGWHCYFPADNEICEFDWRTLQTSKTPNVFRVNANPEFLTAYEPTRYCGWSQDLNMPVVDYLSFWAKEPGVEFFGKNGLCPSKSLINKAKQDGNFRKWLRMLSASEKYNANLFGPQATLKAYQLKVDIIQASTILADRRKLLRSVRIHARALVDAKVRPERIEQYIQQLKDSKITAILTIYSDYLEACQELGLNFQDTKIAFPHAEDLQRLHDQRIEEANAKRSREDAKKRRALYKKFRNAAVQLKRFEASDDEYCIIIPGSPADLMLEGKMQCNCVGRMAYDEKMANGKSFIAFLRRRASRDTSLVTIEYDLKDRKMRQCYAINNSRPDKETQAFADAWANNVTETLTAEAREKRKADTKEGKEWLLQQSKSA